MTKFDDLCTAYQNSRNKYFSFRDDGYSFGQELVNRFVAFLGVSRDEARVVPLRGERHPESIYSVQSAMHLDDDTFWHLGVRLTLNAAPNVNPQQPILIAFRFKRVSDDTYDVRTFEDDPGHRVSRGNDAQFAAFFESLHSQIVATFENGLVEFLKGTTKQRAIGFVRPEN